MLIVLLNLVEHLSNLLFGLLTTYQNSRKILKIYSAKMFPQVFEVVPYTVWRAVPILYINFVSTLTYSFGDQLIIMISLALGNYFHLFNKEIFSIKGKVSGFLNLFNDNVYIFCIINIIDQIINSVSHTISINIY